MNIQDHIIKLTEDVAELKATIPYLVTKDDFSELKTLIQSDLKNRWTPKQWVLVVVAIISGVFSMACTIWRAS